MPPSRLPAWMQVTNAERQVIWEELLRRSHNGKLPYGEYSSVGRMFYVDHRVVSRIWKRGKESMDRRVASVVASRANKRGRRKKDRVAICSLVRDIPVDARKNQRAIQLGAGISAYLVQQLLTEGFMRRCLKQTRPLLTADHRRARVEFCLKHVIMDMEGEWTTSFDHMHNVVHIDEKWFYVKKVGFKLYVMTDQDGRPMETAPVQFAQSGHRWFPSAKSGNPSTRRYTDRYRHTGTTASTAKTDVGGEQML